MADGPLHPACRGAEAFRHLGIEDLGHRIDDIHILHRDHNGFPQVLIALNVGRDTNFMDDGGDRTLQPLSPGILLRRTGSGHHLPHPLHHCGGPAGLHHKVIRTLGGRQIGHTAAGKAGNDQYLRLGRHGAYLTQHLYPVQRGQYHVHYQHIALPLTAQLYRRLSVSGFSHYGQIPFSPQCFHQKAAKFLTGIRHYYLLLFHI